MTAKFQTSLSAAAHQLKLLDQLAANIEKVYEGIGRTPVDDRSDEEIRTRVLMRKWSRDLQFVSSLAERAVQIARQPDFDGDNKAQVEFLDDLDIVINECQALFHWLRGEGRPPNEVGALHNVGGAFLDAQTVLLAHRRQWSQEGAERERNAVAEWKRTHPTHGQTWQGDIKANYERQRQILTKPPWQP